MHLDFERPKELGIFISILDVGIQLEQVPYPAQPAAPQGAPPHEGMPVSTQVEMVQAKYPPEQP